MYFFNRSPHSRQPGTGRRTAIVAHVAGSVCRQCGACCAFYRVSFYWAEARQRGLPDACCEPLTGHLVSLAGTNRPAPRCYALDGELGKAVACRVYAARPSPCREVQPGDDKCNQARAAHGLQPLRASGERGGAGREPRH